MNNENDYYLTGGTTDIEKHKELVDKKMRLMLIEYISNLHNTRNIDAREIMGRGQIGKIGYIINKSNWVLFHETLINIFEIIDNNVVNIVIDDLITMSKRLNKLDKDVRSMDPELTQRDISMLYTYNINTNEVEYLKYVLSTKGMLKYLQLIKNDEASILLQLETKPFTEVKFNINITDDMTEFQNVMNIPVKSSGILHIFYSREVLASIFSLLLLTNENVEPLISEIKNILLNFMDPITYPINNTMNNIINNDFIYELIWIVSVYVIEILIFMLIYYIQKNM